jgi:hypothetical protein
LTAVLTYTRAALVRAKGDREMADVTFPLSFEDLDSLLANEQLPSELAAVFEDLV